MAAGPGLRSCSHDGCHRARWHRRQAGPKSRSSTRTRRVVLSHRPRRSASHSAGWPFRSAPLTAVCRREAGSPPGMDEPRLAGARPPPSRDGCVASPSPRAPGSGRNAKVKPLRTYSLELDLAPRSATCVPCRGSCPRPPSPPSEPHGTSVSSWNLLPRTFNAPLISLPFKPDCTPLLQRSPFNPKPFIFRDSSSLTEGARGPELGAHCSAAPVPFLSEYGRIQVRSQSPTCTPVPWAL